MFSTKTFYAQWRLGLLYSNLFCYHKSLVIIIYTDLKSKYNQVQSSLPFLILCSSDDRHQRTPRKQLDIEFADFNVSSLYKF